MIYLEETLNPAHASPEALDNFIEFAQKRLVPICPDVGARLVAAWSSNIEWFCQVQHVFEFDDMEALKSFRIQSSQNKAWGEYAAGLEEHAPMRRSRLLEPLEVVPTTVLHQAITESQQSPVHGYLHATLEVGAGKMEQFEEVLAESHKTLPIIASWRPISGGPNEIIDVWKMPESIKAYEPATDDIKGFFSFLREIAPKERAVQMIALPYSPLK